MCQAPQGEIDRASYTDTVDKPIGAVLGRPHSGAVMWLCSPWGLSRTGVDGFLGVDGSCGGLREGEGDGRSTWGECSARAGR